MRRVNCEHMQALVTNVLERHWSGRSKWVPGFNKYQTTFMASLDVRAAFDVAKPRLVARMLTMMDVHAHVVAMLEEMKDVRGSACFENWETEFRYSKCSRQDRVEAPVLCRNVAECVLWRAEEKRKARGMGDLVKRG